MAALDALARRDHASADLRRKLLEKGYDVAVVAPLLEALRAEKLLDDRRYTENFVAYHAARGQGPLRVRAELRRHGLEGIAVEERRHFTQKFRVSSATVRDQIHPVRR